MGQFMKVVRITSSGKLKHQVLELGAGDMRTNEDVSPVVNVCKYLSVEDCLFRGCMGNGVVHVKLTGAIPSAGWCTWITIQLPELSVAFSCSQYSSNSQEGGISIIYLLGSL